MQIVSTYATDSVPTSMLCFVDDVNVLAYRTSNEENCKTLEILHKKLERWASRHRAAMQTGYKAREQNPSPEHLPWAFPPEHTCLVDGDQQKKKKERKKERANRVIFRIVVEHRYVVREHPQHTNNRVVVENVWKVGSRLTRPHFQLLERERARGQDEKFRVVEKMLCSHAKVRPVGVRHWNPWELF